MAEDNLTCNEPCPDRFRSVLPCSLAKGHDCKHCNGILEWHAPCDICGSREGVRRFAVTVDGEALRLARVLCGAHGDAYLLKVGGVLGELVRADRPRTFPAGQGGGEDARVVEELKQRWRRLQDDADARSDGLGGVRAAQEATAARVLYHLALCKCGDAANVVMFAE